MPSPFTDDGPGSQCDLLRQLGMDTPLIDALWEEAKAIAVDSTATRSPIRRTTVRAILLDYLLPRLPRRDRLLEGIARIDKVLHAYAPKGARYPRKWGLYSSGFEQVIRMCFEAAGLRYPKTALTQYRKQVADGQRA